MKFDVFMTLKGAARTLEAPASNNPIEADSLKVLLTKLAENLIDNDLVKTVGVRVEPYED